jgi:hypothetical protein
VVWEDWSREAPSYPIQGRVISQHLVSPTARTDRMTEAKRQPDLPSF